MSQHLSSVDTSTPVAELPEVLERFCTLYNQLDKGNLRQLKDVYSQDIHFQDPFGQVSGLNELTEYMARAYDNVLHCRFRFSSPVIQQQWCTIPRSEERRVGKECGSRM